MNVKALIVAMYALAAVPAVSLAANAEPPSAAQKTGDYIEDSALTTKVKAALLAEKNLKSLPISVESTDGVVTLPARSYPPRRSIRRWTWRSTSRASKTCTTPSS
jgi:hyperosmotically inducible protein